MWFSVADIHSFLIAPWSLPIRRACPHLSEQMHTHVIPRAPTPRWVGPQCIQRWIAQTIATRLAWQAKQPGPVRYRFGRTSAPCWSQSTTIPHERKSFLKLDETDLLWLAGIELERLYRIARTPQAAVGETLWTLTLLASCLHLAQIYQEYKRRHKARQARAFMRRAFTFFVTWRT